MYYRLLASTKIKAHRKLPFVQLLSKIYLNSEKDLAHNCQSLTKNRYLCYHSKELVLLDCVFDYTDIVFFPGFSGHILRNKPS